MIEQGLTDLLTADLRDEVFIPAPRSGKHYELYVAEVLDGRHGCLDAPVGD